MAPRMMLRVKMMKKQPATPDGWLDEIAIAIADARGAMPFGSVSSTGNQVTDINLFHLAPLTCMKFRGFDIHDEDLRKKVTEGALANYVANSSPDGVDHGLETRPLLDFAVCYITAHYVLDLIDEDEATATLDLCEENLN